MPARRQIFGHRDGFNADSVLALQDLTTLNPLITAGALAFLVKKSGAPINASLIGWLFKRQNRTWGISISGVLFLLSVIRRVSNHLSRQARNNGVIAKYDWARELVVVTGASSGIGGRVCQMLSERGIKVVGIDVQQPLYALPSKMKFYICDITSKPAVFELAKTIQAEVGHPTILLNNAGIGRGGVILEMEEKDIHAVMNVNAISHFWTVQAFLPHMLEQNHGHILTVASMASYVSPPGISVYGMSKAAALSFHESLTMEITHFHKTPKIRTSLINPLWTKTPLLDMGIKEGGKQGPKTMHVDTVAEGIVDAILSGESTHLILPRAVTMGSMLRGFPDWLHWGVMNRSARDMDLFDMDTVRAKKPL